MIFGKITKNLIREIADSLLYEPPVMSIFSDILLESLLTK